MDLDKDHYEALGIRPNAGPDEIELAYRGRRSQYHPDRYASSDQETLDWATSKMKEVNEAYAALTDPALRAQVDECLRRSAKRREQTTSQKPEASPPRETLLESLQRVVLTDEPIKRIYIAPQIPEQKLARALASYGTDLQPQDVIALVDDSFFGGARVGLLITEAQIRFKEAFRPADVRLLGALAEITAHGGHVSINGHGCADLNMPSKNDLKSLCQAITHHLQHIG
ncbi:J domain-containing protein [Xanthomonas campestris]|uniref:J domain-containing protein n=1 Tax=Xanthomonas cannabis TaxID=1885674 RepID=UPI001E6067E3|nr:J domain-containing protein [Xanthomonas campestris pv. zinniae]